MKLKHIIIVLIYTMSFSLIVESSFSQCGGGGAYSGNLTMLPTFQTIGVDAGDRYTFDGYANITYIFSFCQGGGSNNIDTQIEICDQNGTVVYEYNDDHCGLGSELTWTCPANGTYSIVIHQYYCNASGAYAGQLAYRTITPPNEQDCLGAIPLCFNTYNTTASYSGTGNYWNEIPTYGGSVADNNCPGNCLLGGEINDVWYTFTAQTTGTVSFIITPNNSADDYDWAVYDLTSAECMDIATNADALQVSCNFCGTSGSTGPSGASAADCQHGNSCTNFNDDLNVTAGETYVVNVSNWSATQSGYTISFGGTAQIVDNTGPYIESILYAPECGSSSITVQFNERLWCTSVQPEDFVISGPNGNYDIADVWSEICEAGLGSTYGDTYYDDIWTLELNDYLQHDGDYTLTVEAGGVDDICSNFSPENSVNFTIVGITADTAYSHSSCYGANDGWAEISNISGATAPYTIDWTGPSGFTATGVTNISGLSPGAYVVTVDDATGRCEFTETFNIGEPTQISFNTSIVQPTCGNSNGSITVNGITGMFPPYDIACTGQPTANNVTSHTFNNLPDGSYTITVTDDQGCFNTTTVNLVSAVNPDATFTYNGNQCFNTQSFDFTHTGAVAAGETYNWTFTNGTPASSTAENPSGVTFSSAGSHNVTLNISAGGCNDSYNLNVTVYPLPVPNVVTTDDNCGNCDGTATADAGFASYNWSSSANTTNVETGLCDGSYSVEVVDANGCIASENFTINPNGVTPNANVVTTQPSCPGDCDATATVNATGPATFSYAYSSGSTPNNQTTGGLCAGAYDVTVADGSNPACFVVENFNITDPPSMVLTMSGTDANCGLANGSASVTVSGGTAPYDYDWSNGGTANTINGIPAGNYTVTVTDANNCTEINSIIINDTGAPFTVTTSVDQDAQCAGACDGQATATAVGAGPFTYQWSSGTNPTNFAVTGLCVGTHTVTVTEGSCIVTETVTITQPTAITGTVSSTDAHCGLSDGSITVSPSGGTVATDYSYEWDCVPAQYTATANNLASGTYHVTVEDDNGCTAEFSGSIMNVGGVAINETHTATQCSYSSDASATVNVLSGDPDFTYAWSHGVNQTTAATSHTLNDLAPQPYTVTVTDTWGCSAVTNFNINAAPVLNASITSSQDVSCNGLCDGTATANGVGGTGALSYDWGTGNGATPNQPANTGFCPGSYVVTVTDANSCTATAPVTIDEPVAISLLLSSTDSHCNQNDGTATVVPSGGTAPYTYLWSGGTQPTNANNTGLSAAGSPYSVQVTDDNGCVANGSVTINNVPGATVSISNTTDITCFGDNDGTATVSIGGGAPPFTIEWGTTPTQNAATAINLAAGTHTVTVTDMYGCTYDASAVINEPSSFTASATAPVIDCYGTCTGSALATPNGGTAPYTYLWNDFQNSQMAVSLCAGDYEVTATDDNGCTAVDNVTITENDPIVLDADITDSDCGQSNGAIDLTISGGSVGAMTIDWDYGPHTEDLVNIPAGSYTVTVTDSKGCQAIQTFAVSDLSGPTLNISSTSDVGCFGDCNGQATVQVIGGTGPFDYHWDTSPVQTNPTATNLCAGTYMITVTDMTTGCISISSATINEPDQLDVSSVFTNPECHNACNGQIQLTTFNGTAPYSYNWVGPGTLPATEDLTNLCDGTYTVVITDNNGCMITRNFTLIEPSFITAPTTVVSANCSGTCDGEAIVNPSGGNPPYTYEWSDINSQTSQTAYNLCPGIYGVTVTDDNGCTTNNTANIPSPSALSFGTVVKSDPICYGSANGSINVSVNGGTPPYSYSWDSGSSNALADNLLGGTHCVTVSDGNGCFIDTCILINEPPQLNIAFDISNETCNGLCDGEIEAIASGGTPTYEYIWSNGSINPMNDNLCAGLYLVTVTDQNGCQFSSSASISGASVLDIVVQDTVMPHCGNTDGSITVGVIGGTSPYLYNWSNPPGGSTSSISGIPNGNYTVTVTDANSCTAMKTIDLNDEDGPIIDSIVVSNIDCYGNSSGEAIVYFTSITSTNSIEWNDPLGQTSAHAINLSEGNYTVTITDDNGCQASETISITEPNPLSASISSFADASCFGNCNGSATASFSGGTPPVMYSWSSGQNTASVGGLCPGTYSVTITDSSGCTAEDDVEISEPTEMVITENIFPVTCHGGSDGSITVSVSGGTGNYDYEWFGTSGNDPVVTGLSSASYTLVVYNANDHSCFTSENYFVPQPSEINAIFNTVDATCNQDNGGAYVLTTFGGTPGYNYSWTPGNFTNTDSIGNLAPGSYECLVSDAYGCTASFSVNVGETPAPVLDNVLTSPTTCFGYHDGTAQINVSSGTPPYTYNWRPNVSSTNFCDTLPANLYTVTITDQNGCHVYATVPISSPEPVVTILNPADSICIGQTAQVGATASGGTAPYSFLWENLGYGSNHYVTPELTTDYTVIAEDINGCLSSPQTVQILVQPPLDLTVITPNSVCLGESAILSATAQGGDGNYVFNWGDGTVTNNPQIVVAPAEDTDYTIVLTDGCGSPADTADVTVRVAPQPIINITRTPNNGCSPISIQFDNNTNNYTYSYLWNFDDDESGENNFSEIKRPVHYYENPGYYEVSLTVTTDQGCIDSGTINIQVKEAPIADFNAHPWTAGMMESNIHFNDESIGATAWLWHFGNDAMSTIQNPNHVFSESGEIPVKLIAYNNIGCTDTVVKYVNIIEDHRFYMPTAINVRSPGNDEFYPKGVGIDLNTYQMSVYNRWGEPIFITNDINEHWLGRYDQNKGEYVQQGVYTWVVTLTDKHGKEYTYSGRVMVFK
jgi:PKD repeat protein